MTRKEDEFETTEEFLDARKCLEIILGTRMFFEDVIRKSQNIKKEKIVEPSREIGKDEFFLINMDEDEKLIFSLYVSLKEEIKAKKEIIKTAEKNREEILSEINFLEIEKEKTKAVLWVKIHFRICEPEIEVDFSKKRVHIRQGFKIVLRDKEKVPYSKKID